jgi:hypothetical protein
MFIVSLLADHIMPQLTPSRNRTCAEQAREVQAESV